MIEQSVAEVDDILNLFGAILMMPALGWLCHLVSPLQSKSGLLVK